MYLNYVLVTLSASTFRARSTPFISKEQLQELRREHRASHVISRRHDRIVAVPLTDGGPRFPGEEVSFHIAEVPSFVANMMRASILRFIELKGYRLLRDRPPTFMNRKANVIQRAAQNLSTHPLLDALAMYPTFSIDPRVLYPRRDEPMFGIQLNSRLSVEIKMTARELLSFGVDLVDKYVVGQSESRPLRDFEIGRDERATRRLLGRVARVENDKLYLAEALGDEIVEAEDVLLESRFENLIACLERVKVAGIDVVRKNLSRQQLGYSSAEGKMSKVTALADGLRHAGPLKLAADLHAEVRHLLTPQPGSDAGQIREAKPPRFVFDIARTKTSDLPRSGLEKFGPFDVETFSSRRPDVLVIVPDDWRGAAEIFLGKFKDGLPNTSPWTKGFSRKYHLADCKFHIESFGRTPDEVTGYRDACLKGIERLQKPNLAIVVVESQHRYLTGDSNPYLVSKSVLMGQGVAVQEVNIETLRQPDSALAWTLDNFALASYAKMGGTPFVIATTQTLAHELIVGLGNAVINRRRIGQSERVVGITTVFSADGNYLFSSPSREVDFEQYPEALLTTLRDLIELVRKRNAWQKGDDVRLIFHAFKPLRDVEAIAVKQLVEKLAANYRVEFAFLHVNSEHDWFLFDTQATGVGPKRKAKWVPRRGVVLPLGDRDTLLTVSGPSEVKTAWQGVPKPLLLQLHRESTFNDLDYLADQVFKFTGISWRQFLVSSTPATIGYSNQIAKLLGRLRHVRNWNPDILRTQLRHSRWFL
jgi:hypothetical protein